VGAMVVAGAASIVEVRAGLLEAVKVLASRLRPGAGDEQDDGHGKDLPSSAILILAVIAIALVAGTYYYFTRGAAITAISTGAMVVMAFFFTAVASYIVGLVGNSNSPVSGMTITAVLFTGGLLWLAGFTGMEGMVATLGVAAIVCCVACTSGDVCNDLKTGQLVGATPWRQQLMQILGVAVAALVMAPVLQLLHDNTASAAESCRRPRRTSSRASPEASSVMASYPGTWLRWARSSGWSCSSSICRCVREAASGST
jgi:putative OPT family oligopeptide transporter